MPRKPSYNAAATSQPEPPPAKRSLSYSQTAPTGSLQLLNIGTNSKDSEDVTMQDVSDEGNSDQPRKRAAVGDGISAGSVSPFRERDSESPPPRRSRARPTSDPENQRPPATRKQLWSPDNDTPFTRASVDPANIASLQAQKSRAQALQQKNRNTFPASQLARASPTGSKTSLLQNMSAPASAAEDSYDIILQPETKPISQEQLVAEVKGIYAGLVMVEAKCIEVDNKQAALAQADGSHTRLNNEQWQALIALHRTLLHEHHDFFLVSTLYI